MLELRAKTMSLKLEALKGGGGSSLGMERQALFRLGNCELAAQVKRRRVQLCCFLARMQCIFKVSRKHLHM
jgi:hypothetical protein